MICSGAILTIVLNLSCEAIHDGGESHSPYVSIVGGVAVASSLFLSS